MAGRVASRRICGVCRSKSEFYIVWPFLLYVLPPKRTIACIATLAGAVVIARTFSAATATTIYNLFHWDGLLLGGLLAAMDVERVQISRTAWRVVFVGACLIFAIPQVGAAFDWQHWRGFQTISYTLIALAGVSLIALTRMSTKTIFMNPVLTAFGRKELCSVSAALSARHLAAETTLAPRRRQLVPRRFHPVPRLSLPPPLLAALSYGLAEVTWWALESRALALKRHFEYR
jgi:hypothetical protein